MNFGFIDCIKTASSKGRNAIIAEIKPFSPIHGDLLRGRKIADILRAYERAGSAAISYITAKQFGGDFETLKEIVSLTELPVLRKDFIRDRKEIERSAEAEVSALLLIARQLRDKTPEFVDICFEHAIEPLVEVHRHEDIIYAENARAVLINNRDIERMERDNGNLEVTARLAERIETESEAFKISGSGISTIEDLLYVLRFADAALIGTAFMMAENTEDFVRKFVEARKCLREF